MYNNKILEIRLASLISSILLFYMFYYAVLFLEKRLRQMMFLREGVF